MKFIENIVFPIKKSLYCTKCTHYLEKYEKFLSISKQKFYNQNPIGSKNLIHKIKGKEFKKSENLASLWVRIIGILLITIERYQSKNLNKL